MAKRKSSTRKKTQNKSSKDIMSFKIVHPHAAGIDIGSRINWACIGEGEGQTRSFGVFTEDHHEMAKWFISNGVTHIAMESTGVYWKSLFLILQSYGLEPILVNAGHVGNIKGKKTDIKDCQWIWQLHSVGFLHASFQPDEFTEELRTYNRHRQTLIKGMSQYVSRMQKALVLMNLQLPIVLSDIMGKSGRAIIQSILRGERDAETLANLADYRVKADKATIKKALTGHWHTQHLFTLKQNWEAYEFQQKQIAECDAVIENLLEAHVLKTEQKALVYEPSDNVKKKNRRNRKNAPNFDIATYSYQLTWGVDLMEIDGLGLSTVLTIASEVGLDANVLKEKFPSAKHFVSWLGLSPNRKVTGGKVISSKSRKNKHPLAIAFRQAANTIRNQKENPLADFFRRLKHRKGPAIAIAATARKLAMIFFNMVVLKQQYQPQDLQVYQDNLRNQSIKRIQKTIQRMSISENEIVFNT